MSMVRNMFSEAVRVSLIICLLMLLILVWIPGASLLFLLKWIIESCANKKWSLIDVLIKGYGFFIFKSHAFILARIGVRIEVEGLENLPKEDPVILCSKHQSYLDMYCLTYIMWLNDRHVFFLAKEGLKYIPGVGDYVKFVGGVFVKRNSSTRSDLSDMITKLKETFKKVPNGVFVFYPEGTRTKVGDSSVQYKNGMKFIYNQLKSIDNMQLVPMALNTGVVGRTVWDLKPGLVIFKILPAIDSSLNINKVKEEVYNIIESETRALEQRGLEYQKKLSEKLNK